LNHCAPGSASVGSKEQGFDADFPDVLGFRLADLSGGVDCSLKTGNAQNDAPFHALHLRVRSARAIEIPARAADSRIFGLSPQDRISGRPRLHRPAGNQGRGGSHRNPGDGFAAFHFRSGKPRCNSERVFSAVEPRSTGYDRFTPDILFRSAEILGQKSTQEE
jgi:hypothetical protein